MARRMAPSGDVAAAAGFQNHPVFATHRHEVPMSSPSRLALLETMMLIRAHEERLAKDAGQTPGTCTAVGQEAAAAGVMAALSPRDRILTNHRSAGHLLARGADPGRLMAEILGRADGYCRGKSGSLHISVRELGVVLTSTIVGAADLGGLEFRDDVSALNATVTGLTNGTSYTFTVPGAAVVRVEVDPEQKLPDVNRKNNSWSP